MHIVVAVHGIRTYGDWYDQLNALVHKHSSHNGGREDIEVIPYNYGFFGFPSFIFPPSRKKAVHLFKRVLFDYLERSDVNRVSVVGHSFGTYLILNGIAADDFPKDCKIENVIFAGSALPPDAFARAFVRIRHRVNRIVNDCGTRDLSLLPTLLIAGTGMAGRIGLHGPVGDLLHNRYFDFGHSTYFERTDAQPSKFMKDWWLPILFSQKVELSDTRSKPPNLVERAVRTLGEHGGTLSLSLYFAVIIIFAIIFAAWQYESGKSSERAKAAKILSQHAALNAATSAQALSEQGRPFKIIANEARRAFEFANANDSSIDNAVLSVNIAAAQLAAIQEFNESTFTIPGRYRRGAISPSGRLVVAVDEHWRLWQWDLQTLTKKQLSPPNGEQYKAIYNVQIGDLPNQKDIVAVSFRGGTDLFLASSSKHYRRLNFGFNQILFMQKRNSIFFSGADSGRLYSFSTDSIVTNSIQLAGDKSHIQSYVNFDPTERFVISRKYEETVITEIDSGDIIWSSKSLDMEYDFDNILGKGREIFWTDSFANFVATRKIDENKSELLLIQVDVSGPGINKLELIVYFNPEIEKVSTIYLNNESLLIIKNVKKEKSKYSIFDTKTKISINHWRTADRYIEKLRAVNENALLGMQSQREISFANVHDSRFIPVAEIRLASSLNSDGPASFMLAENRAAAFHLRNGELAVWRPSELRTKVKIPTNTDGSRYNVAEVLRTGKTHTIVSLRGRLRGATYLLNGSEEPKEISPLPSRPCRIAPKGEIAVCYDPDKSELSVFSLGDGALLDRRKTEARERFDLETIAFSRSSNKIAVIIGKVLVLYLGSPNKLSIKTLELELGGTSVAFNQNGSTLLVATSDATVNILNLKNLTWNQTEIRTGLKSVDKAIFTFDEKGIIAAALRDRGPWSSRLHFYPFESGAKEIDFALPDHSGNPVRSFNISRDNIVIMTVGQNTYVWDLSKAEGPIYVLRTKSDGSPPRITPSGESFWLRNKEGRFTLYATHTGRPKITVGPRFDLAPRRDKKVSLEGDATAFAYFSPEGELVILDSRPEVLDPLVGALLNQR